MRSSAYCVVREMWQIHLPGAGNATGCEVDYHVYGFERRSWQASGSLLYFHG